MNHVTPGAGALTKRTPHNSRQTKQTATNQQHATEQDTADKQTAERHRDTRTDTQITHNNTPNPKQGAHAQENAPPKTRKPRNCTRIEYSHGVSRHRIRNQRHHTQQPHPTRGAFPSRTQCANHGPATGEREPPRTHPNKGVRPPERRGEPPEHGRDKEKREAHAPPARAKAGEAPTGRNMDPSGQQRNRTSPEQFERTD